MIMGLTWITLVVQQCEILDPAHKKTHFLEARKERTLNLAPPISYKRGSLLRFNSPEEQYTKSCSSTVLPLPLLAADQPTPTTTTSGQRLRSPSSRTRNPSCRLLEYAACNHRQPDSKGRVRCHHSTVMDMADLKPKPPFSLFLCLRKHRSEFVTVTLYFLDPDMYHQDN